MDETYRKCIQKEWEELSRVEREKISKKLSSLGYPEKVHCDEWQAYQKMIP
jgi:mRNA-degrading endonuclease RelE of RelBE toxin-antitoxin system